MATSSNVQIVPPEEVRYDGVTFSPDGNFVYYGVCPRRQSLSAVFQLPILGGTPRRVIDDVDAPLAFSPNGAEFAFIRGYQTKGEAAIIVAAADGSNERRVVTLPFPLSFLLTSVAWSPDGRTLVAPVRADAQRVKIVAFDRDSADATDVGSARWANVGSVEFVPGGRELVVAASEDKPGAPEQIWSVTFPQGEVRRLTNDLSSYAQVTLSRDGRVMATTQREGRATVWVAPPASAHLRRAR